MAPKNTNSKKEAGRARKAENEAKKKDAVEAEKERKEAASWTDPGVKSAASKADKEEKRKAELARKAENARLLAEEEASVPKVVKPAPKAGAKKAAAKKEEKPAGPGAIAAGGGLAAAPKDVGDDEKDKDKPVESYAATGIDNIVDLMEAVNVKTDKATVGAQAAEIERHPERRYKAAYEAYVERELPKMKQDHPGLRLHQYKELLHKQFQKSPDNPFNQTTVSYDATKEEKIEALNAKRRQVSDRLREH